MKMLLFLLTFSSVSYGASCKKLTECVEISSKLSGQKIIYDKKILPFTFELNQPIVINKDNVDKTLSEALNIFGLVRIPTTLEKTDKIIEARELKFRSDLPSYTASKTKLPKIPDSHDPVMVTYQGVRGVDMEIIAQNVEPLLSRYGKVSPMRDGSIVVTDLAIHVNKILSLIHKQDFPLTGEEKMRIALEKKRAHELEIARLKSGEMHEIGPHRHKK
jgi:type II secretory pathway component GspD/PulD (secretin)